MKLIFSVIFKIFFKEAINKFNYNNKSNITVDFKENLNGLLKKCTTTFCSETEKFAIAFVNNYYHYN